MSRTKLYIIGGVAGLVVLVLLVVLLLGSFDQSGGPQRATLQFWGVFDDGSYYTDALRAYERINPNVKIAYRRLSYEDYEQQLLGSFAAGAGPDIWLMHNTWLPKHGDKIQPMPAVTKETRGKLPSFRDFQDQFADVVVSDLTLNGQIYALPIYADTLALYYNKDIFNSAGIASPPANWDEFNDSARQLTQTDQRGNIIRAGAAIGTARNINRSTDILGLLMLQSGVQMTDLDNAVASFASPVGSQNVGEVALQYYTDFANPTKAVYTWDDQQHYSIDAFIEGKAAMMINYSHQILALRARAPRFNFAIAPVPQPIDSTTSVNYANYWAPTVSKQSKNGLEAWKFLTYLSSAEGATKYLNAANRPAARRDLISSQQSDTELGVFATQNLSARSWFQVDNGAIEKIFAEMIDDVNFGRASIRDALQTAESKVNVLMQRNR